MIVVESGDAVRQHCEERSDRNLRYVSLDAFLAADVWKQIADRTAEFDQTRNAATQFGLQARQAYWRLPC